MNIIAGQQNAGNIFYSQKNTESSVFVWKGKMPAWHSCVNLILKFVLCFCDILNLVCNSNFLTVALKGTLIKLCATPNVRLDYNPLWFQVFYVVRQPCHQVNILEQPCHSSLSSVTIHISRTNCTKNVCKAANSQPITHLIGFTHSHCHTFVFSY